MGGTALPAPELDGGLAWFNTPRPLTLRALRGHVVLLDFWTYCCVNCMHVLPVLHAVEERFQGEPLVVIGVHSGKFSAEHDPARIREAIGRYGVRHPVVVDDSMAIWGRYAIRSWPTLVVVRPDGTIAAVAPGEPRLAMLEAFIERELDLARKRGTLAPARLALDEVAAAPAVARALSYPGKVSVLPDGRLVVSDSGHHRVLISSAGGDVLLTAGSGLRGHVDGPIADAAFDDPQGTCWYGGAVYVADARNHAIRRIDLEAGRVSTVAGTGLLGESLPLGRRLPARATPLRSPWDLAADAGAVYVAMAGSHQICRLFPETGEIEVYAGSGVEALIDGRVASSAWAQPSGLSLSGRTLYVADSETSAVRAIDLDRDEVRTLVGEGLFDWGDEDGVGGEALLQHGLGVAAVDGGVLVADTYNGKIRRVGEGARGTEVQTLLSGLAEPGAIAVAPDGAWIVADTNAHRVLHVSPPRTRPPRGSVPPSASGGAGEVREIEIRGAPTPRSGAAAAPGPRSGRGSHPPLAETTGLSVRGWFTALLELPESAGLSPGEGTVALLLEAPPGTELSAGAPVRISLEVSRRSDLLLLSRDRFTVESSGGAHQLVTLDTTVTELPSPVVEAEIVAAIEYMACEIRDQGVCARGTVHARIPVRLRAEGGSPRLELIVPLAPVLDG